MDQIALTDAELAEIRRLWRRVKSHLVASAALLDKPFTNAPDQSPWTRLKPDVNRLDEALKAITAKGV